MTDNELLADRTSHADSTRQESAPLDAINAQSTSGYPDINTRSNHTRNCKYLCVIEFLKQIVNLIDKHNGLVSAIATVIIACLTLYLVKYAGNQEEIINGQLSIMKIEQRPWVTIDNIDIRKDINGDMLGPIDPKHPMFHLSFLFKNSGKTPAYVGIRASIVLQMEREIWDKEQGRLCHMDTQFERRAYIFPNSVWKPYFYEPATVGDIENTESYVPAITGCVFYRSEHAKDVYKQPFYALISHDGKTERKQGDNPRVFASSKSIPLDELWVKDLQMVKGKFTE